MPYPNLSVSHFPTLICRRGQSYSENEDPGLAKYRERFFNFYDQRVMDGAWTSAKVWACGCYAIQRPPKFHIYMDGPSP